MKTICLLITPVFFLPLACLSQEPAATPPRPSPPYINRAPAYCAWTVTFKSTGEANTPRGGSSGPVRTGGAPNPPPAPPPKFQRISVVKAGDILFEEQVNSAGLKTDRWLVGEIQAVRVPGASSVTLSTGRGEDDLFNCTYTRSDFPGLEWLSDDTYNGEKKVGESDCFIFRGKVSYLTQMEAIAMEHKYEVLKQVNDAARGGDTTGKGGAGLQNPNAPELRAASYTSPAVACIDKVTRLPVLLQVGTEVRSYQFSPTPPGPITLPPDVQQAITQRQQRVRAAAATPATP